MLLLLVLYIRLASHAASRLDSHWMGAKERARGRSRDFAGSHTRVLEKPNADSLGLWPAEGAPFDRVARFVDSYSSHRAHYDPSKEVIASLVHVRRLVVQGASRANADESSAVTLAWQ